MLQDHVHVFLSTDGSSIALTTAEDGSNLPNLTHGEQWLPLALIPLAKEDLAKYVTDPDAAIANVRATGFCVSTFGAEIIQFPAGRRRVSRR